MPDEEKKTPEAFEILDEVGKTRDLVEGRKVGRVGEEFRKRAVEYAIQHAEGFDANTDPDDLSLEEADNYLQRGMAIERDRARTRFSGDIESILSEMPSGKLESLALLPPVVDSMPEGFGQALERFAEYQQVKRLNDKYDNRGAQTEAEKNLELRAAYEGMVNEQRTKMRDKGFSEESVNNAAQIARIAIQNDRITDETIKKHAKPGLAKLEEKRKKKYDEVGRDVTEGVKEALRKLGKSDNEGDVEIAMNTAYHAYLGDVEDWMERRRLESERRLYTNGGF